MAKNSTADFRWVHAMGGRDEAAQYLCSLRFGTVDVEQMKKRLSFWTNTAGHMGGNAIRAMASDRGTRPSDFEIMTPDEYAASLEQEKAA